MNIETFRLECLSFRSVTEGFPFDGETLVFKVQGKVFAAVSLRRPDVVALKCAPTLTEQLRERYHGVGEAEHWGKTRWNHVRMHSDVPDDVFLFLIRHAYAETLLSMPKKAQVAFFAQRAEGAFLYEHLHTTDTLMHYPFALHEQSSPYPLILATADLQRAGHGGAGTHWEAENGKNLLLAYRLRLSGVPARDAFALNQATALSLRQAVAYFLPAAMHEALTLKWPNDVYYENDKLAGMLVNTQMTSTLITSATVGIGLNVNQCVFRSDAPNPTSLRLILGYDLPRFLLLERFVDVLHQNMQRLAQGEAETLRREYAAVLYRRTGFHPYKDATGRFRARIANVLPTGELQLTDENGQKRTYAFKEVTFL